MNVLQLSAQLISTLAPQNFTWGVGANEAVLSRVVVGPVGDGFFQHDFVSPCGVLHVEAGKDNDEHPADLVEEQRWTLYLFAENATEQSGGAAVTGGNRNSVGSSRGRGLLEIEPLVKAKIFNALGLTARPRTTGGQPTAVGGKMAGLVAERALEITATRIPSLPDYAPITQLVAPHQSGFTIVNNGTVSGWQFMIFHSVGATGTVSQDIATAGTDFAIGASAAATAANLRTYILSILPVEVTATISGATVTIGSGTETLRAIAATINTGGVSGATGTSPITPAQFSIVSNTGIAGWTVLVVGNNFNTDLGTFGGNVTVGGSAAATAANLHSFFNTQDFITTFTVGTSVYVFAQSGHSLTAVTATQNSGTSGCVTGGISFSTPVIFTFAAAPTRYDLIGYTWVRVAGSTPPSSPSGGTFVASPSATSFSDTPGAGSFAYAFFWAYDSTIDPYGGTGTTPVAPDAWSSYQTAQGGLVYLPATAAI